MVETVHNIYTVNRLVLNDRSIQEEFSAPLKMKLVYFVNVYYVINLETRSVFI